jgi:hypothetical protein
VVEKSKSSNPEVEKTLTMFPFLAEVFANPENAQNINYSDPLGTCRLLKLCPEEFIPQMMLYNSPLDF